MSKTRNLQSVSKKVCSPLIDKQTGFNAGNTPLMDTRLIHPNNGWYFLHYPCRRNDPAQLSLL